MLHDAQASLHGPVVTTPTALSHTLEASGIQLLCSCGKAAPAAARQENHGSCRYDRKLTFLKLTRLLLHELNGTGDEGVDDRQLFVAVAP